MKNEKDFLGLCGTKNAEGSGFRRRGRSFVKEVEEKVAACMGAKWQDDKVP